jgi:hypothetical protein
MDGITTTGVGRSSATWSRRSAELKAKGADFVVVEQGIDTSTPAASSCFTSWPQSPS